MNASNFRSRRIAAVLGLGAAFSPIGHAALAQPATRMTAQQMATLKRQMAAARAAAPRLAVDAALKRAGANAPQLRAALQQVPPAQREGLQFLLANMPDADLQTLSARFLLDNVALAYAARDAAPWKTSVPPEVFLNDVLPYASLNEARDGTRRMLREKALPLVAGCRTPSEAAQKLNAGLFPLLRVRYSTERQRPDQAPSQSIGSGLASCSGLAILLVDACRAVGVPARVVGTPLWANGRGNHTWVEIYDGGWHFTGAAEPDAQGLDRAWFSHDASQATKGDPQHAIYATSFRKTGLAFPLVWAPDLKWVNAVDVTDRYAPVQPVAQAAPAPVQAQTLAPATMRVLIKVLDEQGKRIAAPVAVQDAESQQTVFQGVTKDEGADTNDLLVFNALPGHKYRMVALVNRRALGGTFQVAPAAPAGTEQLFTIDLRRIAGAAPPAAPVAPPIKFTMPRPAPQVIRPLPAATQTRLQKAFTEYFAAMPEARATYKFSPALEAVLRGNEPAVRAAAWQAFKAAPHPERKADFDANQTRFGDYLSPYTLKTVGTRPAGGWPLFIAMHGGGGAPKEVNDQQWQEMQRHYFDHPELGGYKYLALRAPNDTWNGFYDDYVYPLVANLIESQVLYGDVDASKVFVMGYSHGGYGAYAIGPKMPDRFAAIHASAGAATDGEFSPKTLRNTVFTAMVGEGDTMYDRLSRNQKLSAALDALRGTRTDIFPNTITVMMGHGHSDLPDRDMIVEMYPNTRNAVPRELTWEQTDGVIRDFFWLHTEAPGKTREIDATCHDNRVTVTTTPNVSSATVLLDTRLVDFSKPVMLDFNGVKSQRLILPSLKTLCDTMARRGDPDLAFSAQIEVLLGAKT